MNAPNENDARVAMVGDQIRTHLVQIARHFVPAVKLTLLARHPDYPDGSRDMVVTRDDLGAAITALQVRLAGEESSHA